MAGSLVGGEDHHIEQLGNEKLCPGQVLVDRMGILLGQEGVDCPHGRGAHYSLGHRVSGGQEGILDSVVGGALAAVV